MIDYIELGPVPYEEQCEQLGPRYDPARAKAECKAYIAQLRREHGEEPAGARLVVRSNPHDFGTYHEVAVKYSMDIPEAEAYAYKLEGSTPANWDDDAKVELGL